MNVEYITTKYLAHISWRRSIERRDILNTFIYGGFDVTTKWVFVTPHSKIQKKKNHKIYLKVPSIMYFNFSVWLFLLNVCFIGCLLIDQLNFFSNLNCQRFLNKVADGQTFIIYFKCSLSRTWIYSYPCCLTKEYIFLLRDVLRIQYCNLNFVCVCSGIWTRNNKIQIN